MLIADPTSHMLILKSRASLAVKAKGCAPEDNMSWVEELRRSEEVEELHRSAEGAARGAPAPWAVLPVSEHVV